MSEITSRTTLHVEEGTRVAQVGGTHYEKRGEALNPWNIIPQWLADDRGDRAGLRFNALKYLARAGEKGPYIEDVRKAKSYCEKLIELCERHEKDELEQLRRDYGPSFEPLINKAHRD